MSWKQLGLFLEREAPVKKSRKVARARKVSKSKPIKREQPIKRVKLADGELDDRIDDVFPIERDRT